MIDLTRPDAPMIIDESGNLVPAPTGTFDSGILQPQTYEYGAFTTPPIKTADNGQVTAVTDDQGGTQALIEPKPLPAALPPVAAPKTGINLKKYLPWIIGGAALIYFMTRKK